MFELTMATNHIILFENFLTPEFCNNVRQLIDEVIKNGDFQVEKWSHNFNVNCQFFNSDKKPQLKELDQQTFKIVGELIKKLYKDHNIPCSGDSGYCFRKIHGPTRLHKDGVIISAIKGFIPVQKVRKVSVIMALNGDYEGGEFYFPKQEFSIKLKKGDVLCFPPYYTHPHQVSAPLHNTFRYTINTWLYE